MSRNVVLLSWLLVLFSSTEARAQTVTDERVWFGVSFQETGSPGSPWRWTFESFVRSREGVSEVDVTAVRPTVIYALTSRSSIGGGFAVGRSFPVFGGTAIEQRVFGQYVWSGPAVGGTLTLRTRAESRFIDGNSGQVGRLRQQVRFARALGKGSRWSLVVFEELLLHVNNTTRVARGIDQNRAFGGVSVAVTESIRFEIGYLNQFSPGHRGAPDRMNHVLSSGLAVSF